jgi:multiple sugar transport system permease protein
MTALIEKSATVEETPAPRRPGTRRHRQSVGIYIAVIVCVALFGVPFLWILLTALATPDRLAAGAGALLSTHFAWHNLVEAVTRVNLLAYGGNSLFLATLTAVLTTLSSATAGFAFARLRAPGGRLLFTVLLATMMIPSIATLIPTYLLFSRIGLVGTYWPWVLWGLAGSPYLIFLFRQFFAAVPLELEDAAIVDGAGWIRIFTRVFLPLSRPVIMTSLLLSFTWTWGDYLAPALLLNLDNTTLAVAVTTAYKDAHGNGILTLQAAAAVLYLLPVLLVFQFAQRHFISSALGSGVKG